jgi:hypothetical protein
MSAIAIQFLRAYFANTTGPTFICSLANEKGRGCEHYIISRDPAAVRKFLLMWDVAGRSTYYCTGTLKAEAERIVRPKGSPRCTENIAELVGLHIDVDFKNVSNEPGDILRQLLSLPLPPTIVVRSGHGWQGFWLFREPIGTTLGGEVVARVDRRALGALLASDAVHDLPRLMRLPGSHNSKIPGESIEVTIEQLDNNRRYDLDELESWISEQLPLFDRTGNATKERERRLQDRAPRRALARPDHRRRRQRQSQYSNNAAHRIFAAQ